MIWLLCGCLIPSFAVSWAVAFVVRSFAPRLGLVDHPGDRKVHEHPIPLGGGIAIWCGVVLPLAVGYLLLATLPWESRAGGTASPSSSDVVDSLVAFVAPHVAGLREQSSSLWALLSAATILAVLGLVDDARGLDWRLRLAVETAVAAWLVFGLGWRVSVFVAQPMLMGAFTVVWIVGVTNAFNMLDNMDGLAAGVGVITSSILAAVLLVAADPSTGQPQLFVAGLLLVIAGSLFGFLMHNAPPARIFMGDAGSYFVGFSIAVATVLATFTGGNLPRHAIFAPVCVLAVPLYDLASVVLIRLRAGRSPFAADKSHLSHRFVELGFTSVQAVAAILLLTATCGLGALLLHQVSQAGAMLIMLQVGCVLTLVAVLEMAARKRRPPEADNRRRDR